MTDLNAWLAKRRAQAVPERMEVIPPAPSPTITLSSPPSRAPVVASANVYTAMLSNKAWRMANMYQILNEDGEIVPFVMREEQIRFLTERHFRNFVPKTRKYGISTVIVIDYLDDCIFANPLKPVHAAHVDYRDEDAQKKLDIAKRAWMEGPNHPDPNIAEIWRGLHESNPLVTCNDHELSWSNGSVQQASTSFMGGTPIRCHVSEFGPLAAQFPERAAKLKRGTFNAVPVHGVMDIETTMEGGAFGDCFEIFELAAGNEGREMTPGRWKMFFIPWWRHPSYIMPGRRPEKDKTKLYFADIYARFGLTIPLDRQAWYEDKQEEQGWDMYTQYPTVISECLMIGSGACYFDGPGLEYQRIQITPMEITFQEGDITVQGDVKDYDRRSATFERKPHTIAPFVIAEHPMPDEKYILYADFGVGKMADGSTAERDTNSFGVIRAGRIHPDTLQYRPPQVVCSCQPDDRSITTETIRRIVALSIYYGDCKTMPEINNKDDIAPRLMAAGVRDMWRQGAVGADGGMPGTVKTAEVYGWLTQDTPQGGGTRGQMLDNMQSMTMKQEWVCTFPWILRQMGVFIINKKGRAEAAPGEHDDHVTGPAMGLFGLPHATKFRGPELIMVNQFQRDYADLHHDARGI